MSDPRGRPHVRMFRTLLLTVVAMVVAPPVGIVMAAIVLAVSLVQGRYSVVLGLPVVAFAIGLVMPGDRWLAATMNALLVAAPGCATGLGLRWGWSYVRVVSLTTFAAFVAAAAALAAAGPILGEFNAQIEAILQGPDRAGYDTWVIEFMEMQSWIIAHWTEIYTGAAFFGALACACIIVTCTTLGLRDVQGHFAIPGGFRLFRPPDWVVWLVIAAVAAGFAEHRWPNDFLQIASSNAGIALFGLYWINGLAIAVYTVHAFKPNPFLVSVLVISGILFNLVAMLAVLGLFDTWAEFRRKIDDALAARQLRENSHDDSA